MVKSNYVRIRNDVDRSIKYLLEEQGVQLAGIPGVVQTKTTYVNEVLMNDLAAKGQYPPKDGAVPSKYEIEDAMYEKHMHTGIFSKVDEINKERHKRGHYAGKVKP